ncbi:SbcC/MukB-like Walker B domain-containing protein [Hymenobacter weizhouensis]|uniref:SbcC/MukB-like Walker B domain-containing protein n=1 Tax=Hymenobacter sp. YIM 151500-1 TaxID=2987689 RepID=UPI0022270ECA|nr:AAA family ATPase [Hymenobacter sp. YIM 151500-1]UYZ64986.1 AAA family ATPase [Hymenobacter sp. YIM 151500-1]
MKILRVRFSNLNSLRGEHAVDFATAPLADAGLFAITGPTGAGKTTILDAITLALYGQVPRHEGTGPEQVMSHGTGESWAEVEFEVNGRRYRSKWGQHRARKKAGNPLQDPRMELSEAPEQPTPGTEDQWPILESYKSRVPLRVAELSGLEYRQFLRSVLLAQGDFTRFLKSSAGERAQLLEKITDTKKYSDISRAAFERAKQEAQQVETLRTGLAGVVLLSPEEVAFLEDEIRGLEQQVQQAAAAQRQLLDAQGWLKRLEELRTRQHAGQVRLTQLTAHTSTLTPLRQRLTLHQQAAPFATNWALLRQADEHIGRLGREAEQLRQRLPHLEQQQATAQAARQAAEQARDAARRTQAEQEPRLREAEQLDLLMAEAERQLQLARQEYDDKNQQCKQLKATAEQAAGRARALREQARDLRKWLDIHQGLSELTSVLPELAAYLQDWEHLKTELGQLEIRLREARQRQHQAQQAAARHQQAADAARQQQQALAARQRVATAAHGTWLRRLRLHVAGLHQQQEQQQQHWDDLRRSLQLQQLILSHTDTRQLLEAGQPCPVCGALEHPYVAGVLGVSEDAFQRDRQREEELSQQVRALDARYNRLNTYIIMLEQAAPEPALGPADTVQLLPESGEKAAAEEVKALVQQLRELRDEQSRADQHLAQALTQHEAAARQEQEYAQPAADLARQLADAQDRVPGACHMIQSLIRNFGLAFGDDNGRALLEQAQQRTEEFRHRQEQFADFDKELSQLTAVEEQTGHALREVQAWLQSHKQELVEKHEAIQAQRRQRQQLFDGPDVARQRQLLQDAVQQAEAHLHQAEQHAQQHATALVLATTQLRQREQDVAQQQQARDEQHTALTAALSGAGLAPDPAALTALLLPEPEVRRLSDQLQRHDQDVALAQQALTDLAQQLQQEQAKALTQEPLEAISHQLTATTEQLTTLNRQLGQRQERLGGHRAGLERHAALAAQLEKQQQEARRWRQLADLIGSADGKKFSEFAQGLTLARLVDLANRHLHRFTDRYRILRNPDEHLDLLIQDDYQAGAVRSMNSLSGGESFLVSLALALGLSELAGHRTQIDTLFIDEGFGTLDPDTLDVALSALEMLQGSGKTIGIISHVEALKERVTTQINVRKGAGGISSLQVVGFGEEL